MSSPTDPRLADLVGGVVKDVQTLVSGQVELVKSELAASAKRGATGAILIALAAFFALFALLMLAFAAGFGLTEAGLDPWAAFLIVAGVMLLVTAILIGAAVVYFKRVRGPVQAQIELEKTKSALAELRPPVTLHEPSAATTAGPNGERAAAASGSTTVFPSYGGQPPAP